MHSGRRIRRWVHADHTQLEQAQYECRQKEKMSLDKFIEQVYRIGNKEVFTSDMLERLFTSIELNPFVLLQSTPAPVFEPVVFQSLTHTLQQFQVHSLHSTLLSALVPSFCLQSFPRRELHPSSAALKPALEQRPRKMRLGGDCILVQLPLLDCPDLARNARLCYLSQSEQSERPHQPVVTAEPMTEWSDLLVRPSTAVSNRSGCKAGGCSSSSTSNILSVRLADHLLSNLHNALPNFSGSQVHSSGIRATARSLTEKKTVEGSPLFVPILASNISSTNLEKKTNTIHFSLKGEQTCAMISSFFLGYFIGDTDLKLEDDRATEKRKTPDYDGCFIGTLADCTPGQPKATPVDTVLVRERDRHSPFEVCHSAACVCDVWATLRSTAQKAIEKTAVSASFSKLTCGLFQGAIIRHVFATIRSPNCTVHIPLPIVHPAANTDPAAPLLQTVRPLTAENQEIFVLILITSLLHVTLPALSRTEDTNTSSEAGDEVKLTPVNNHIDPFGITSVLNSMQEKTLLMIVDILLLIVCAPAKNNQDRVFTTYSHVDEALVESEKTSPAPSDSPTIISRVLLV
ncbi:hypothetical protein BLNAU_5860 [Blattamonas nauphoetae]|uniref:Uncharacterized protein n=1 Tax=Blattamonas nauphoetae TaxID=2049346 RepID=A0ABQ9Y5P3_9EUKA|nr:hypothetical protein BLNAU_5860 [Blattamonas nauphoetae]